MTCNNMGPKRVSSVRVASYTHLIRLTSICNLTACQTSWFVCVCVVSTSFFFIHLKAPHQKPAITKKEREKEKNHFFFVCEKSRRRENCQLVFSREDPEGTRAAAMAAHTHVKPLHLDIRTLVFTFVYSSDAAMAVTHARRPSSNLEFMKSSRCPHALLLHEPRGSCSGGE